MALKKAQTVYPNPDTLPLSWVNALLHANDHLSDQAAFEGAYRQVP